MEHRLARVGLAVEHETCAGFFDTQFLCDNLGAVEHLAHQFAVFGLHVHDGCDMALGHHEKVHRGLRGDVVKGEHVVVFVDFLGRDFSLDDFTEKAVFTHNEYKVVKRKAARFSIGTAGKDCRGLVFTESCFSRETGPLACCERISGVSALCGLEKDFKRMGLRVSSRPSDFKVVPILPADSSLGCGGVSVHSFTDKKRLGWECSPPVLVVDFYFVGGVTFAFLIFAGLSIDENVGYGAKTSIFKGIAPETLACKNSAHVLVVCDSIFVVWLKIGGEIVM